MNTLVQVGVVQENHHRVMDLRANEVSFDHSQQYFDNSQKNLNLVVGSQIAAEARKALKV